MLTSKYRGVVGRGLGNGCRLICTKRLGASMRAVLSGAMCGGAAHAPQPGVCAANSHASARAGRRARRGKESARERSLAMDRNQGLRPRGLRGHTHKTNQAPSKQNGCVACRTREAFIQRPRKLFPEGGALCGAPGSIAGCDQEAVHQHGTNQAGGTKPDR